MSVRSEGSGSLVSSPSRPPITSVVLLQGCVGQESRCRPNAFVSPGLVADSAGRGLEGRRCSGTCCLLVRTESK